MSKNFVVNNTVSMSMTGRVGEVDVSYAQLVAAFGKPVDPRRSYGSDSKVKAEWRITSLDGKVRASIYDYKSSISAQRNRDWHVGGDGQAALQLVRQALGLEG